MFSHSNLCENLVFLVDNYITVKYRLNKFIHSNIYYS